MGTLKIPAHEREELNRRLARAELNLRALELFSRYLNLCPRYVQPEDVRELTEGCGVSENTAFRLLMEAACGLDAERDVWARRMSEEYFRPAIRCEDAAACASDPYYQAIRMPEMSRNGWRMGYKTLHAYEAFTADDLLLCSDGREVPRVGYFREDFRAPVVYQDEREWMTVTPSEIHTMTRDIEAAYGRTVVFGLGLGYYAFMAARKPQVSRVVVVERDPAVIALFREQILPQFPNAAKVGLVQADAYDYAVHMAGERYDTAYVDIWHDVLDGVEMYLRMKRHEAASPTTRFLYWIEPSMLAWLRGMALMEVAQGAEGKMLSALGRVDSVAALDRALSQEGLREIAHRIPLEVARR